MAALLLTATAAPGTPPAKPPLLPRGVLTLGDVQRMDVNAISMQVGNSGSLPWDFNTGNGGLEYPKGSGKRAVFASGLWLSTSIATLPRATVTGYCDEFAPGAVVLGSPDDPARPIYKVYRLDRHYATPALRDAALAAWNAGAVAYGAQGVAVLPDGSLDIAGDEMCWSVCNDLDPATHLSPYGDTFPLGIEVQQTTFAFNQPGALESTVYVRYRIVNRGIELLQDLQVGMWSDPDIGGDSDDLSGCDVARGMGYCYNAAGLDLVYGTAVPAVGFDVVSGPINANTNQPRSMTAFGDYANGSEPVSATESYNAMRGLEPSGAAIVDPTTFLPTKFRHAGDPIFRTGWLDASPGDKRVLVSSGPTTLPPGEQLDVVFAIILAQGTDRLASLSLLRSYDDQAQATWNAGASIRLGAEPPVPHGLALEYPSPNPVRGTLRVAMSLPDATPATLELLDVAGRVIARQDAGRLGAGRHVVQLLSTPPPPGLYLVRLSHGAHVLTAKVVVVR